MIPTLYPPRSADETQLEQKTKHFQLLIGRLLLGGALCFWGGYQLMFIDTQLMAAKALTNWDVTAVEWFVSVHIAFYLMAGMAILLGFQFRLLSVVLFFWLIGTSFIWHSPWQPGQLEAFCQTLALAGAVQFLMITGPGLYSLDVWLLRESAG